MGVMKYVSLKEEGQEAKKRVGGCSPEGTRSKSLSKKGTASGSGVEVR